MPDTSNPVRPGPERDEAAGYRPVSGLAVAALAIAATTAVTVVGIWVTAKVRGRPILVWQVLLAAAVALGLAVAARWQIGRAQGARTGRGLATWGFWLSLLTLGGYGAYYAGTDLAVRRQAQGVADQFFALLADGKPELAFRLTRHPSQQRDDRDAESVRKRYGSTDLVGFGQGDLPRMFRTWPGKVTYQFNGERDRVDEPDGFQVDLNYVLRSPEGRFEVAVGTRGYDDRATGGRDWQVLFPRTGLKPDREYTKLGRLCLELQSECRRYLYTWSLQPRRADSVARILRKEGAALPDGERQKVVEEIVRPNSINVMPGAGPMRPPPMPNVFVDADGTRFTQTVEVDAPTVGPNVPAVLTVRLAGDALVKEMVQLSGPGWEQQPVREIQSAVSTDPELRNYQFKFEVVELNLRPSLPRISQPQQGGP